MPIGSLVIYETEPGCPAAGPDRSSHWFAGYVTGDRSLCEAGPHPMRADTMRSSASNLGFRGSTVAGLFALALLACQSPRPSPAPGSPLPSGHTAEDTALANTGLRWVLEHQISGVVRDSVHVFLSPFVSQTSTRRHRDDWLKAVGHAVDAICDVRDRAACPPYDAAIFIYVGIGMRTPRDSAQLDVGADGDFPSQKSGWWNGRVLDLVRVGGRWRVVGYHDWLRAS